MAWRCSSVGPIGPTRMPWRIDAIVSGGSDAPWATLFTIVNGVDRRVAHRAGHQVRQRAPVVDEEEHRHEEERRGRDRPLQHGHLDDQSAYPLGVLGGGDQTDVRSQRHPAQDRRLLAELVEEGHHLLRVGVHPVVGGSLRLVAATVAEQVEEHHAGPSAASSSASGRFDSESSRSPWRYTTSGPSSP